MQYRGVAFNIKVSIERGEWVWIIHTPKPRQGKLIGPRAFAVRHAMNAIDAWRQSHPREADGEISVG